MTVTVGDVAGDESRVILEPALIENQNRGLRVSTRGTALRSAIAVPY